MILCHLNGLGIQVGAGRRESKHCQTLLKPIYDLASDGQTLNFIHITTSKMIINQVRIMWHPILPGSSLSKERHMMD